MRHDPDFIARSREAFKSNAGPSLQDLRDKVAGTATGTNKRDILSALDTVARIYQKPLVTIRAHTKSLQAVFQSNSAAQVGLSEKRFQNVRSLVVRAMRMYGDTPAPITKRIILAPAWAMLLGGIEKRSYRMALNRLACFCSYMNVLPEQVAKETLLGLFGALAAEEVVKSPRRLLKHTIAIWNMCGRTAPGWPSVKLASPFDQDIVSLPLSAFPATFREDLSRWRQRLLQPDVFDAAAPPRALRKISVDNLQGLVVRFASAVVRLGKLTVEDVADLTTLVRPAMVKAGLEFFLERAGEKPTPYVAKMATTLFHVAKHYCRIGTDDLALLQAFCRRLKVDRRRQLTARNRDRLRQFDDPANVAKLLAFPEEERARGLAERNPYRAAKCFERAATAALFLSCCLRIQNLRTIDIHTDLQWIDGKCFLSIPAERVKNSQALDFELPPDVGELIKEYIRDYRPRLSGSHGPFLFPGKDGGPRPHNTVRTDFEQAMRKRAGLVMNPHLVRHVVAKIVVERDPGAHVAVSQHLGHTRIDTTLGSYLGTETRASSRHINKLLKAAQKDPALPKE